MFLHSAHIDKCGEIATKHSRTDFRSIDRGCRVENAPADATQQLAGKQHRRRRREEYDKDEPAEHDARRQHGPLHPELLSDVAVETHADHDADGGCVGDARLPRGRELIAAGFGGLAELLLEGLFREQSLQERLVVAVHDDGHGDEGGPGHGLGVHFEAVPRRSLVLRRGGRLGIVEDCLGERRIVLDLGDILVLLVVGHGDFVLDLVREL